MGLAAWQPGLRTGCLAASVHLMPQVPLHWQCAGNSTLRAAVCGRLLKAVLQNKTPVYFPFFWLLHATQAIVRAEWSSTGVSSGYIIWCKDISSMPKHTLQLEAQHSSFRPSSQSLLQKTALAIAEKLFQRLNFPSLCAWICPSFYLHSTPLLCLYRLYELWSTYIIKKLGVCPMNMVFLG